MIKPFIATQNGGRHVFGEPFTPDIKEISFALSNINRYNGHVGCYTVAEHCVRVARQLPDELMLAGLLHDAHEAYYGDITAPLKRLIGPAYGELCDGFDDVIDEHFGVDVRHPLVKEADLRMLVTEAMTFGIWTPDGWPDVDPYAMGGPADTWLPAEADACFMALFIQLTGGKYEL